MSNAHENDGNVKPTVCDSIYDSLKLKKKKNK